MISGDAPGGWGLLLRGRIVVEPVGKPLNWKAVARVTRGRYSGVLGALAHVAVASDVLVTGSETRSI